MRPQAGHWEQTQALLPKNDGNETTDQWLRTSAKIWRGFAPNPATLLVQGHCFNIQRSKTRGHQELDTGSRDAVLVKKPVVADQIRALGALGRERWIVASLLRYCTR